jgi:hypothetical protein
VDARRARTDVQPCAAPSHGRDCTGPIATLSHIRHRVGRDGHAGDEKAGAVHQNGSCSTRLRAARNSVDRYRSQVSRSGGSIWPVCSASHVELSDDPDDGVVDARIRSPDSSSRRAVDPRGGCRRKSCRPAPEVSPRDRCWENSHDLQGLPCLVGPRDLRIRADAPRTPREQPGAAIAWPRTRVPDAARRRRAS